MIENQQLSYFTILYTNDGLTHHAHMNFTKKKLCATETQSHCTESPAWTLSKASPKPTSFIHWSMKGSSHILTGSVEVRASEFWRCQARPGSRHVQLQPL
jgi:hypothetical protein